MDWHILYFLQDRHTPFLDGLMPALSLSATGGAVWIVLAVLLALYRPTRQLGCTVGLALLLMHLSCNELLKPLIMRDRPCWIDPSVPLLVPRPSDYSFPSGHTAASFAAAGVLLLERVRFAWPALLLAVGIAFSRLYVFVHFPTDVLGGVVLGAVCAAVATAIIHTVLKRWSYGQGV